MQNFTDILEHISEALDPEDIVDRLGISSKELCDKLADEIEAKIEAFEDVYMDAFEAEDYE
jgi:AraC-like DNA-binding protein